MRHRLKELFNNCAAKARKPVGALLIAFTLSMGYGPAVLKSQTFQDSVSTHTTYWKIADRDVTLKIEPCPGQGLCMTIHTVNPSDPKVKEFISKLSDRPAYAISDSDVLSYCGYPVVADLHRKNDGSWDGTVRNPFYPSREYGLHIIPHGDGSLEMHGYKWIEAVGTSMYMNRLPSAPRACHRPPAR